MKFFNNQMRAVTALLFLVGTVALFSIDYSNTVDRSGINQKDWQLPVLTFAKSSASDKKTLQQLNLWKSKELTTTLIAGKVDWSIKGIVFEAEIPYALIYAVGNNQLLKFKVNDLLPNGERLTRITKNSINIRVEGVMITKRLHPQQSSL